MDWNHPLRAVASTVDVDVLQVLGRTHVGVTGLQLAQLAGRSYAQVSAVVDRLAEQGLVLVEQHGRTYSYRLNRDHVVADAILDALGAAERIEEEITHTIEGWELPPISVAIFGSAARREGEPTSDVDLLVVRPDNVSEDDLAWAYQTANLAEQIELLTGNPAQLLDLTLSELLEARRSSEPLVASLRIDARTLAGSDLHELIAVEAPDGAE
jgi:predicted nucleotidyltransferase